MPSINAPKVPRICKKASIQFTQLRWKNQASVSDYFYGHVILTSCSPVQQFIYALARKAIPFRFLHPATLRNNQKDEQSISLEQELLIHNDKCNCWTKKKIQKSYGLICIIHAWNVNLACTFKLNMSASKFLRSHV